MLVVVLLAVVLVVVELVRVVDQRRDGEHEGRGVLGVWERKFQHARALLTKVIPLTALKMVVVVWQIITQVRVRSSHYTVAQGRRALRWNPEPDERMDGTPEGGVPDDDMLGS